MSDMFVEVASDAALATLAGLFPELLPVLAASVPAGKEMLKPIAKEGLKMLGDWAASDNVRGKHFKLLAAPFQFPRHRNRAEELDDESEDSFEGQIPQ